MDYFLGGVQLGFIYSLLALGIVLVYRATRVINFAHADFATFGTFIFLSALNILGSGFTILCAFLGFFSSGLIAFFISYFVFYEAQRRGVSPLGITIGTIAVSFFIQSIEIIIWGAEPKSVPSFFPGRIELFGFSLSKTFILVLIVSLLTLSVFYLVITRTKFGISIRAVSQNPDMSRILGVRFRFVVSSIWGISAAIAGISGILLAPLYSVDQTFLFDPFLKAFIGAIIGGIDSVPGAVFGSIIVGLAESLFGGYVSIKYKTAFIFLIGIISLALRPEGIFGREIKERV
ncbi:High-affinity branched-chain amino acid transport system permease protein LivH [bacterium HR19]|nr:High-affinity branched-chain amino acid transport system permease protein LivH [bacterium HR19]